MARDSFPRFATTLVGREADLEQLATLLRSEQLVTVAGPGGVGKTRLAVELATREALGTVRFFVDLSRWSAPGSLWEVIAGSLGLSLSGDDAATSVVTALSEREALLILDNCEHILDDVVPVVAELLACGSRLRVLATSREPLGLSMEVVHWLRPLSTRGAASPAVQLFLARVLARNPAARLEAEDLRSAHTLCAKLEGLPLALELAAGWTTAFTFKDLVSLVSEAPGQLRSIDRTAPVRHRTLGETIAWSADLLNESERALFKSLGVFFSGSDASAVRQVCGSNGDDPDAWPAQLARLVHCSLVRLDEHSGHARYTLLEPIRQWCRSQLSGDERAELERRHSEFFAGRARELAEDLRSESQLRAKRSLDPDLPNFRAAMTLGEPLIGLSIATSLAFYWPMRGLAREGLDWLHKTLDAYLCPDSARAEACIAASFLSWRALDLRGGETHASDAMAIFDRLGDDHGVARARLWRAMNAASAGRAEDALTELDAAEPVIRRAGDLHTLVRCSVIRSQCALRSGDSDAVREVASEGLSLARKVGDRAQITGFLDALGHAERSRDPARAAEYFRESLMLRRDVGDVAAVCTSLYLQALLARDLGNRHQSARFLAEMLEICLGQGDRPSAALALLVLADLGAAAGARDAAAIARTGLDLAGDPQAFTEPDDQVLIERGEAIAGDLSEGDASLLSLEAAVAAGTAFAALLRKSDDSDVAQNPDRLTPREIHVLRLLTAGHTNAEIAGLLGVSVRTIERHISNLYTKVGARGRADATAYCLRHGLNA